MSLPRFALLWFGCAALSAYAAGDYTVYVSNEHAGTVSVIDGATRSVRATWPVGKRPRGIHATQDGTRLYVAVSGSPILAPGAHTERATAQTPDKAADGIAVVDPATGKVLRKISVGSDPEQFALTRDDQHVVVSNEDESTASCWDVRTGERVFATPVTGEPEGVALNPARDEVYITCEQRGDIFILNSTDGHQIATAHVRGRPRSVAFLPDGSQAYVPAEGESEVSLLDSNTHQITGVLKIPGIDVMPMCAITAPDGKTVYVSTGRGNSVAVIDTATNTVTSTIAVGHRPWGIALSPDGSTLFAANGKSDDVSVVDLASRKEIGRIKVGKGPWGIAVGAGGAGALGKP